MAHAHAHARQPQIAPSCHVRARTKTAHDTIPIRRVCQCRGKESTSSSAPPPLGTSSSAPPPQPLLLSPSSSAPPPNASTHRQLKRSCLPASQPRHLFSLLKWLRTVDLRLRTPHSRPSSATMQHTRDPILSALPFKRSARARARGTRVISLSASGAGAAAAAACPSAPDPSSSPPGLRATLARTAEVDRRDRRVLLERRRDCCRAGIADAVTCGGAAHPRPQSTPGQRHHSNGARAHAQGTRVPSLSASGAGAAAAAACPSAPDPGPAPRPPSHTRAHRRG